MHIEVALNRKLLNLHVENESLKNIIDSEWLPKVSFPKAKMEVDDGKQSMSPIWVKDTLQIKRGVLQPNALLIKASQATEDGKQSMSPIWVKDMLQIKRGVLPPNALLIKVFQATAMRPWKQFSNFTNFGWLLR